MNEFEGFIEEATKQAQELPKETREMRLARIQSLWEKYRGDDAVISFEDIARFMENEPPVKKVMSNWGNLNNLVEGFRYEQLVVLSAQEKSGKTSFAFDLADSMREEAPCYFLFEQSAQEIIRQRNERGQPLPHGYAPRRNTDNRWEWVEKRMFESMVKYGSRVFIIDNVDWLQKEYGYNQRTDEVLTDLLLKLKGFCQTWQVIIFLIAHVKKVPMETIPQPDDIKGSSAFKQIADIVLILWRKTKEEKVDGTKTKAPYRTKETLVWVAENRQTGKTGYAQFIFDGKQFLEKEWDTGMSAAEEYHQYEFRS